MILYYLLIHFIPFVLAGKSRTNKPSKDVGANLDWSELDSFIEEQNQMLTDESFLPSWEEYSFYLIKAHELAQGMFSGMDLEAKQLELDDTVLKESFGFATILENVRNDVNFDYKDPLDRANIAHSIQLQRIHNLGFERYMWEFVRNSLNALLDAEQPSSMIYQLYREIYRWIDLVRFEVEFQIISSERSLYHHRHAGKKVREELHRQYDPTTEVYKHYAAVFSKVKLTDPNKIRQSIDYIALRDRELRQKYEDSVGTVQVVFERMETLMLILQLYRTLTSIVARNEAFMEHLETISYNRNPKIIRDLADRKILPLLNLLSGESKKPVPKNEIPVAKASDLRFRIDELNLVQGDRLQHYKLDERFHFAALRWKDSPNLLKQVHDTLKAYFAETTEKTRPLVKPFPIERKRKVPVMDLPPSDVITDEDVLASMAGADISAESFERLNIESDPLEERLFDPSAASTSSRASPPKRAPKTTLRVKSWSVDPSHNLCGSLDSLPSSGRFHYVDPGFFLQAQPNPLNSRKMTFVPRESVILNKRDFGTLCAISALDVSNIRWKDVEVLVEHLGGSLRPLSGRGSVHECYIPTRQSFRSTIHRPHTSKLYLAKAKSLKILLRKWGIDILKFKFLAN
jgi:hypothetical protein